MRFFLIVSVISFAVVCAFASDLTDEEARPRAVLAIRESAKWTAADGLYVRRREEFENKIFEDQVAVDNKISKAIYVFEVSQSGCDATPDGEKSCSVVLDADPRWYVAVDRSTGNTYRLSGFEDSDAEFNRMVQDGHLRIEDESAAEDLAILYFTLRFGPDDVEYGPHHAVATSLIGLKHNVESDFDSSYPDGRGRKLFDAWWSDFCDRGLQRELKTKAKRIASGYEVKLKTLEKMDYRLLPKFKLITKRPVLQERTITVSLEGVVSELSTKRLFPR